VAIAGVSFVIVLVMGVYGFLTTPARRSVRMFGPWATLWRVLVGSLYGSLFAVLLITALILC
jgi:hypothetical protein